jgi:phage terminase small subunit
MLTPKQEQFVKAIALDGMNYSDAYRSAYNCKRMSDTTINNNAWKLIQDNEITTRIKELAAQADSPKIMSATKRREKLTKLANDEDPNVAMKAIDLLNKMDGEYVQKVEAAVTNAVNISIELSDD